MGHPTKLARWIVIFVLGTLSLLIASHGFTVFATRLGQVPISQSTPAVTLTPQAFLPLVMRPCPPLKFSDEFDGNTLDRNKWDVIRGTPTVSGGWLTLRGAEIQSKAVFQGGCLQGAIRSADWKPQTQFTDSSFGFELWTGTNGQCHNGIVFKASGQLAVLRPEPEVNGNCSGDPAHQDYIGVSNWDNIRPADGTVGTVYFTLVWFTNNVVLTVSDGGANEGQASYSGLALPVIPLEIRLYAHTFNPSLIDTYSIDYIRLHQD